MNQILKSGYTGKLKNGYPYRCYATNGDSIHGAYQFEGNWYAIQHFKDCSAKYTEYIKGFFASSDFYIDLPVFSFDWSCLAVWQNWIAMDKDGEWFSFENKPELISDQSVVWSGEEDFYRIPEEFAPKNYSGDFKDSLMERQR